MSTAHCFLLLSPYSECHPLTYVTEVVVVGVVVVVVVGVVLVVAVVVTLSSRLLLKTPR